MDEHNLKSSARKYYKEFSDNFIDIVSKSLKHSDFISISTK